MNKRRRGASKQTQDGKSWPLRLHNPVYPVVGGAVGGWVGWVIDLVVCIKEQRLTQARQLLTCKQRGIFRVCGGGWARWVGV
jgi:hypothetical protein